MLMLDPSEASEASDQVTAAAPNLTEGRQLLLATGH